MSKIPEVYVVSDSLGETAESVAKATISQFDEDIDVVRVPFIRHAEQIQKVIEEAAEHGAVVCHTLVSPELRAHFERIAEANHVKYVDILGPMMDMVQTISETKPRMKPGIIHKLDEEYFKKVEAIEFAVKYDDGKNPAGFKKGKAVASLAKEWGIAMEEIMTFGNSNNDVSMLSMTPWGFAVANASKSAKEAATYETLSNNEDGVAKAVEKYVLGEK